MVSALAPHPFFLRCLNTALSESHLVTLSLGPSDRHAVHGTHTHGGHNVQIHSSRPLSTVLTATGACDAHAEKTRAAQDSPELCTGSGHTLKIWSFLSKAMATQSGCVFDHCSWLTSDSAE